MNYNNKILFINKSNNILNINNNIFIIIILKNFNFK